MGAFCVFGVSRQVCRKRAERKIPTFCPKLEREMSPAEWGMRVAEEGDRVFAESSKQVRIFPEFDAPQFCRDWIAVSPSEVRLTRLMVRGPKTGGDGKPVVRKGVPVLTWLPYDRAVTASASAWSGKKEVATA